MPRLKITTTIDEELLTKAKEKAYSEHTDTNAIIEDALRIYFANCNSEVWEKTLDDGWIKKLIIRPKMITLENIRSRKTSIKSGLDTELLESKGWKNVWKLEKKEA